MRYAPSSVPNDVPLNAFVGNELAKLARAFKNIDAETVNTFGNVTVGGILEVDGTIVRIVATADVANNYRMYNSIGGWKVTTDLATADISTYQTDNAGANQNLWMKFIRNAEVNAYYNGVLAFATQTSGINVYSSATATFAEVRLINAAGNQARVRLGSGSPGTLQFSNEADGGLTNFSCDDAGGTARTCISLGTASSASALAFHGTAAINKPTVTGSRAANAALASLLTALANYGLLVDSST